MAFDQQSRLWPAITGLMILVSVCLLIALIAIATKEETKDSSPASCGPHSINDNVLDLEEPTSPGIFHDLTSMEITQIRNFLENDPDLHVYKAETEILSDVKALIVSMDLHPPVKSKALSYLDNGGSKPDRQGRVILFRKDLEPSVVEERICGPLPVITSCQLLNSTIRRNPVEFTLRPLTFTEISLISTYILPVVDQKLSNILKESFDATFTDCTYCLDFAITPVSTILHRDITKRRMWLRAQYGLENSVSHPVDFAVLAVLEARNSSELSVDKVWYAGRIYDSMDELSKAYKDSSTPKIKMTPPAFSRSLFSTINRRGDPYPEQKLRPPKLVEPDGKRFSIRKRKVEYLGWSFNFRMSSLTGPALYDIKFKGERIAYELSLNEIAVYYSGDIPSMRVLDMVQSGFMMGTFSKALVPGADCPETAVFISTIVAGQTVREPITYKNSFCLFEQNDGIPLRRHLEYRSYYGGMLDSYLTLRSILSIGNYDYIVDFMFHQNGVMDTRMTSTGYILTSPFRNDDSPYGFHIHDGITGNIHHHMFHFKADLDISGTSNRYETLDIKSERVELQTVPGRKYRQIKYTPTLKRIEKQALYQYDFNTPKYHLIHNNANKTDQGERKAYRLVMNGMSKQLLPEGLDSESAAPWARHQLVVTKHKDEEQVSSSPYAMWDSLDPVVDFSKFYEDNENIVDEDLVAWVTMGMHHIPHSEDLPLTSTTGSKLTFSLQPFNFFPECPSIGSRDATRVELKTRYQPSRGVQLRTYGKSQDTCETAKSTYEDDVKADPDMTLESERSTEML